MTVEELENELETKTADIANLNIQLTELSWKEHDAYDAYAQEKSRNEKLEAKNKSLIARIEKMKCCANCRNKKRPETKESIKFCIECKQLDEKKEKIILTQWELSD